METTSGNRPLASIIIVNYQSVVFLARLLRSLFSFEAADRLEVIVVNNDIRERAVLQRLGRTYGFTFIQSETNAGFGSAANIGASRAAAPVLAFINPDVEWKNPCLASIGAEFASDERLGALGLQLVSAAGRPEAWSYGCEPSLIRIVLNNCCPWAWCFFRERVEWVSGGALFVRKESFALVNGFDRDFFLYFEDVDLCRRLRERGFEVRVSRDNAVLHHGGKSQGSRSAQKAAYYESQTKFFRKHRPRLEQILLRILHLSRLGH